MGSIAAIIDFETSKIVVLIGEKNKYNSINVLGQGVCNFNGFRDGKWIDKKSVPDTIRNAIRDAEKSSGYKIEDIYIGIPSDFIKLGFVESKITVKNKERTITSYEIEKLIDSAEFKIPDGYQIIHKYPVSYKVQGDKIVFRPEGIKSKLLEGNICSVFADLNFIKDVQSLIERDSIQIKKYVSTSLAQGLSIIPSTMNVKPSIVIDIGYLSTDVSVFKHNGLVFNKVIPVGGVHITSDITIGLKIPFEKAEKIKRLYSFYGKNQSIINLNSSELGLDSIDDINSIIEPRVEELGSFIIDTLKKNNFYDEDCDVFITGGGLAFMQGGKEFLASVLGIKIRQLNPKFIDNTDPSKISSLGLLYYALEKEENLQGSGLSSTIKHIKDKILKLIRLD